MIIGSIPEGMKSLFVDLLTNGMRVRGINDYGDLDKFKEFFCDFFEESIFHCMLDSTSEVFLIEAKRDKTVLVVQLKDESHTSELFNLATFSLPEESISLSPPLRDVGLAATEAFNGVASWNLLVTSMGEIPINDKPKDPNKDPNKDKSVDKDKKETPDFEWL